MQLVVGALISALLGQGLEVAVGVLAVLALLGAVMALAVKHVQG